MVRSILLFSIFLLQLSCKEKPWKVEKFLFFTVYGVTYDSLNNPHLGIFRYFDYRDKEKIKIAKGLLYLKTEIAPINGLKAFYELNADEKTIDLIQETLSNKDFDSTYNSYPEPRCCYFLYETSNNEKRIITFGTGNNTPYEIVILMQHINSLIETQDKLRLKKPFSVDSMIFDLEREILLKNPPP